MSTVIHLRSETKPLERRSPLSPATAKALIDAGYTVKVEEYPERIYKIDEFRAVGAEIVPSGSWQQAPKDHIILGLKELPDGDEIDFPGTYVHFQHCYKKQTGWAACLSRFARADGLLYDLEFLTDEKGARVSAFGYFAGYAGAAVGLLTWAHQTLHPGVPMGMIKPFDSAPELIAHAKAVLAPAVAANEGRLPRVIVIGALGRCGRGAVDFLTAAGISGDDTLLRWDLAETKKGGPFRAVAESDMFVNAVYLGPHKIPPFITFESLAEAGPARRLATIVDVSCDPNSANNPVPVYDTHTTFEHPTTTATQALGEGPELRIVAIDHLPTLVARESSDEYAAALLPTLLKLNKRETEGVWKRAEEVYKARCAELP